MSRIVDDILLYYNQATLCSKKRDKFGERQLRQARTGCDYFWQKASAYFQQ